MVKFYTPSEVRERLNKDRHDRFCKYCRHYRDCVSEDYYCPPYGLAFIWFELSDRDNNTPNRFNRFLKLEKEIKEQHDKGWEYKDFCKDCTRRHCEFFIYTDKTEKEWRKKVCGALKYIYEEIPCNL